MNVAEVFGKSPSLRDLDFNITGEALYLLSGNGVSDETRKKALEAAKEKTVTLEKAKGNGERSAGRNDQTKGLGLNGNVVQIPSGMVFDDQTNRTGRKSGVRAQCRRQESKNRAENRHARSADAVNVRESPKMKTENLLGARISPLKAASIVAEYSFESLLRFRQSHDLVLHLV
jgi:hypothetical protein